MKKLWRKSNAHSSQEPAVDQGDLGEEYSVEPSAEPFISDETEESWNDIDDMYYPSYTTNADEQGRDFQSESNSTFDDYHGHKTYDNEEHYENDSGEHIAYDGWETAQDTQWNDAEGYDSVGDNYHESEHNNDSALLQEEYESTGDFHTTSTTPARRSRNTRKTGSARKTGKKTGLWKLLLVVGSSVVVLIALIVAFFSPVFGLTNIRIHGNHLVTEQQILQRIALHKNTPLLQIDRNAVARTISTSFPPIRKTVVRTNFPHTLVITVVERVAVAVTSNNQVIDESGVAFGHITTLPHPGRPGFLPLIDTKNPLVTDEVTRDALQAFTQLPGYMKKRVVRISANSTSSIRFTFVDKKVVLVGTASNMDEKVASLEAILSRKGRIYNVSSPHFPAVK